MNKSENIFSNKLKNKGSLFRIINIHNSTVKIMLIAMFLLVSMVSIQSVSANDWVVNPGQSIATAYSNAADNDTIIINPGTYTTSSAIICNKNNITIRGNTTGGDVIIHPGTTIFLNISAGTATNWRTHNIANLTIAGGAGNSNGYITSAGYNVVNVDSLQFVNVTSGKAIKSTSGNVNLTVNNTEFINITGSGSGVTIELTGGATSGNGTGLLVVNNSVFLNVTGSGVGAVIRNLQSYGPIEIYNSSFTNARQNSSTHGGIFCTGGKYFVIKDTNFTNVTGANDGGVLYSHAALEHNFTNVIFSNCTSSGRGGVLTVVSAGDININNCTFENNIAGTYGGAIYTDSSSAFINIINSRFINNSANSQYGGAIAAASATISINNTNFTSNHAGSYGGAIALSGTTGIISMDSSTRFTSNYAVSYGGAIGISGGTINVDNSYFASNYVTATGGYGGAIGAAGGRINVNNSYFISNKVTATGAYGGALGTPGGTIIVFNSEFDGNNANATGSFGGVAGVNGSGAVINLSNCPVHHNFADFSGAFGAGTNGGTINVIGNVEIHDNHATTFGGVVGLNGNGNGVILISADVIYDNSAGTFGGAFAINGNGTINVVNSIIRNNSAGTFGGAVAVNGPGIINIIDSSMNDNTARDFGGAAAVNGTGNITIESSTLARNTVSNGFGGAVGLNGSGTININGSNLLNNIAGAFGGAVGLNGTGTISINGSELVNNRALTFGGAVGLYGNGKININGSDLLNNIADGFGGAAGLNGDGTITIEYSNMNTNNVTNSDSFGGAAGLNGDGLIEIIESFMNDNTAIKFGGAVGVAAGLKHTGTIIVRKSELARNKATGTSDDAGYGGAVGLTEGNIEVYDSKFVDNSAINYGGAVGVPVTGNFYAESSVFNNNNAGTYGGAIGSAAGVNISFCNFTSNHAGTDGGAVAAMADHSINNTIFSCQFEYNSADNEGYAIYAKNLLTANYNRFFNNTDASGNLNFTIVTDSIDYPDVDIDYNWWGDNIPCAGDNEPNNWVMVNVDADNPYIAGGNVSYTYTISLDGNSTSAGFNPSRLPDFFGQGIFTIPSGLPIYDFDAHATTIISVPYNSNNRYQVGYFQVDNYIIFFTIDTRIDPNVTIDGPGGYYKDTVTLNATYTDDAGYPLEGLTVNFYVGGIFVGSNTTDASGFVTIRYTVASADWLNYTADYTGNHLSWAPIKESMLLFFNKLDTTIKVTTDTLIVNHYNAITATVLDANGIPVDAGLWVDFYMNNTWIGRNITNAQGIAVFSYMANSDPDAEYDFSATFNDTGNYTNSTSSDFSIGARKMNTTIDISQVTTKPFRNTRITITLLDEFGNPVPFENITVTISNNTPVKIRTDANGKAYIYHTALQAGNFTIYAEYEEGDMYLASSQTGILVVELLNTTISFKNFIVNALTNASFIVTLIDEDGHLLVAQLVEVYFDGNLISTNTTDTFGRVYIDMGLLPVGSYPISATYAGDQIVWAGSSFNGTLEVRPINTNVTLSVIQDENVSTIFLARLFDEFRQPLSGMPILFYLDGNFIGVGVTDSNGVASLSYAYTQDGKISVEFLGDMIYRESMIYKGMFGDNSTSSNQSNNTSENGTDDNNTSENETDDNNTSENETDDNNTENDPEMNPDDDPANPNIYPGNSDLIMLKAGSPIAMVLLCLISIIFTGFRRKRKN